MDMILIKDVSIVNVKADRYCLLREDDNNNYYPSVSHDIPPPSHSEIEEVYGRKFVNANGETVYIGASKKVQNTIGLLFECFENQNNTIVEQHDAIIKLERIIKRLERDIAIFKRQSNRFISMNLWQRLKFLFNKKG